MFAIFHLGRMENDVNFYSLPNPFCSWIIYYYISRYSSLIEKCFFCLLQNGFQSEGTDVLQCGVESAQLKSIYQTTALQMA